MTTALAFLLWPLSWFLSLEERIEPLAQAHRGKVAIAVKHLESGVEYRRLADEPMPTASLIKLAVMVEAYRQADAGIVDLDSPITLQADDKVPGSGILSTHFSPGARISLRDAIRLMIAFSDNTATNLVLEAIGLPATSRAMESLGFPNTKIHAKVFRRDTSVFPERSQRFGLGSTTASEMIGLLEKLQRGEVASAASCDAMREHLLACEDKNKIARLLPAGTRFAHKTGAVSRARTDAGIIQSPAGPIVIAILTDENDDQRFSDDNAADILCGKIAKIVYDEFHPTPADPLATLARELAEGARGELVEHLQRTLNARLDPPPEVAVDGEFGPQTRGAVQAFQRARNLAITGIVNRETWQALGPLLTEANPVAAPDVVNSQSLERQPADDLDGPPHVTCKSWAIADAKTGEILWGADIHQSLDIASTTKVMTAYLLLREADANPGLLDEIVTFSQRADETAGSTASIRAGERLPVGELLYGLLLPSGNDAAVALAEHLGGRFQPPSDSPPGRDPLARFVAEMNRTAWALGMTETHFANPHGLTAPEHKSTAHDLVVLAHAARKLPRLGKYVATRQRGCALEGSGGYTRFVLWKNSNQLLSIDGYDGMKTGTTDAAGACLISGGRRGHDQLLVVVLGSSSSPGRYADTRNLFRWAWGRREQ